jgi:hypothetical protein
MAEAKTCFFLGCMILLSGPAIGQQKWMIPDTAVNVIKLGDYASTEKLLGAKVWEKHFEADGMLPRIEIVNRDKTQVLRLLFDYGGSRNSVDQFELLAIDKSYKLPGKVVRMDVGGFVTSRKIALGMRKDSVIRAIGKDYKMDSKKGGIEVISFEMNESTAFVKRHNEYKYYIKCSFRNGVLIKYSFGFESVQNLKNKRCAPRLNITCTYLASCLLPADAGMAKESVSAGRRTGRIRLQASGRHYWVSISTVCRPSAIGFRGIRCSKAMRACPGRDGPGIQDGNWSFSRRRTGRIRKGSTGSRSFFSFAHRGFGDGRCPGFVAGGKSCDPGGGQSMKYFSRECSME